ncbi:MAG: sporulation protein YtfJ [Ruminococcaceae bacterium]|nr:sporulation protein YtfJ [Oscillospiraceae bacterium]
MNENKVNDLIENSLAKIRELTGTDTVVGDPIYTPNGTLILPVSKISMGFATGGLDFGKKKDTEGKKPNNYGGGGGTGVTVTPLAFLILAPDGKVDLIPVTDAKNIDTVDKISALIERSPEILKRLKDVLVKKKEEKDEKKD